MIMTIFNYNYFLVEYFYEFQDDIFQKQHPWPTNVERYKITIRNVTHCADKIHYLTYKYIGRVQKSYC